MLQSMEGNPFDDKIRVRGSCMYVPKSMEGNPEFWRSRGSCKSMLKSMEGNRLLGGVEASGIGFLDGQVLLY